MSPEDLPISDAAKANLRAAMGGDEVALVAAYKELVGDDVADLIAGILSVGTVPDYVPDFFGGQEDSSA